MMPTLEPSLAIAEADDLNIFDLLIVLARRKKFIAGSVLASSLLGVILAFMLPAVFTATTTLLPPAQNQSALSMMAGQFGPMAAVASKEVGLRNPTEIFLAMLQSRTVADRMVERFKLSSVYSKASVSDSREALAEHTEMVSAKNGTITIAVRDGEAYRAAALANGYVEELNRISQELAVTEAGQRRLFFEKQLQSTQAHLAAAEIALKQSQEKTGLISLDAQSKVIIEGVAEVQGQIAAREVQLSSMSSFATEQNPEVVRIRQELAALKRQSGLMQQGRMLGKGSVQLPTGKVPEAGLEFARRLREVKYQETVLGLMAKEFEAAKMDEAKDAAMIQVLDAAIAPEYRSAPKRKLIILFAALAGLLLSCLAIAFEQMFQKSVASPEQMVRFELLKNYLRS